MDQSALTFYISEETLNEFKCAECDLYLSWAPVFIRHDDDEAICESCSSRLPTQQLSRNKLYETFAENLSFPCKYSEGGCTERLEFSTNGHPDHEETCEFKPRICLDKDCAWTGQNKDLLEHFREIHPSKVLPNNLVMTPTLVNNYFDKYLMEAWKTWFILEVSIITGKIRHSVFYSSGDSKNAGTYIFNVSVKRGNKSLPSKSSRVEAEIFFPNYLLERSYIPHDINTMEQHFGGLNNITFKIGIQKHLNKIKPKNITYPSKNKRLKRLGSTITIC